MDKTLTNIRWEKHIEKIKLFFTDKNRTIEPKYVKRFGAKNFKVTGNKVYLFDKEIIVDKEQKLKIIHDEDEKYGGVRKAHDRISRKYIGISRIDVEKGFRGSERRQMKQSYHPQKVNQIFAPRPGHVEIDLTFYRGQNIPVFGAIDVYSRYIYYKRVPNKRTATVLVVLKEFIKKFKEVTKFPVYKISTDSGVEFADFKKFADSHKEEHGTTLTYDRQVKSRKLIENLNKSLRLYIERIGWDTIADLDALVSKFVESYNDSRHSTTKQIPNEMVKEAIEQPRVERKTTGYKMAKLKRGDTVRLYDPRRLDIKKEMKERLKGKIKLNDDDYVKRFTSFHRGQAPHWSNTVYTVKTVMIGKKRATRFLLNGKKGFFFRHELQKVTPITKKDPRKRVLARRQNIEKRFDELTPNSVRKSKYERKEMIIHYNDEEKPRTDDKAICMLVYRDHLIVIHDSKLLTFASEKEIVRVSNKTHTKKEIERWVKLNEKEIQQTQKDIDIEFDQWKKQAEDEIP